MSRAFGSLNVATLSVSAAVLVESMLGAWAALRVSVSEALLCMIWGVGLLAGPAVLVSLTLGGLLQTTLEARSVGQFARELRAERGNELSGVLIAAPLFAVSVYVLALQASSFRNVELGSVLVVLGTCAAGLLSGLLGWATARSVQRRPERWRKPALALGAVLSALAASLFFRASYHGLLQLDGRLWIAPLAFAVCFAICDGSAWVRSRSATALWGFLAASVLTCSAFLLASERAPTLVATYGAWPRYVVALGQKLSDVDGDGYSSFLGGGDCAPWNASIHPGAAEVSGDGIDNNCVGGDAGKAALPRRPSWGAQAHGSLKDLNVVVVTIETLRHDHASFVSSKRDTTPRLRELGKESLVFERMYAAAPMTRLSIASLFSSYAPSEIEWLAQAREKRMRRIGRNTPWLPELLSARGYESIAVLTDFSAFTQAESAGFERGFRHYDTSTKLQYSGGTMRGFPAAEQVDKALGYLNQAKRPFFLWLHLFEPHYRYEQPPGAPQFGTDEKARYDAEIWHVDSQLGRLFDALRERGAWDDTVLFVTGDHGEAFGEHGDRFHGSNLYDPQLRTAALLKVPGLPGKRIAAAVTFTDVAPTLARVLGDRHTFDQFRGRSLTPLLHRGKLPDESSSFICESFSVDDGHAYMAALVRYPFKLVYVEEGRRISLFDLSKDPGELAPLDPAAVPGGLALSGELFEYLERARPRAVGPAVGQEAR